MREFGSFVACLLVFLYVTISAACVGVVLIGYNLHPDHWECTKSKVVSTKLPKEEKCIQYSHREETK